MWTLRRAFRVPGGPCWDMRTELRRLLGPLASLKMDCVRECRRRLASIARSADSRADDLGEFVALNDCVNMVGASAPWRRTDARSVRDPRLPCSCSRRCWNLRSARFAARIRSRRPRSSGSPMTRSPTGGNDRSGVRQRQYNLLAVVGLSLASQLQAWYLIG